MSIPKSGRLAGPGDLGIRELAKRCEEAAKP
jgi:hypothetical protein